MAILDQYVCDNCGTLLYGKQGVADIHKDYLSIKGTITFQTYNTKTRKREFVYITDVPNQLSTFCNTECLKQYGIKKINKEWMRQEIEARKLPYNPKYEHITNPDDIPFRHRN